MTQHIEGHSMVTIEEYSATREDESMNNVAIMEENPPDNI